MQPRNRSAGKALVRLGGSSYDLVLRFNEFVGLEFPVAALEIVCAKPLACLAVCCLCQTTCVFGRVPPIPTKSG